MRSLIRPSSHGLSTEQFPVSAYVGSSKNLKDLKDAHRPRLVCCCQIEDCARPFPHRGSFDRSLSIVEIVIIADDAENLVVDVQDRALEVHGAGGPLLERETNPMREVRDV